MTNKTNNNEARQESLEEEAIQMRTATLPKRTAESDGTWDLIVISSSWLIKHPVALWKLPNGD